MLMIWRILAYIQRYWCTLTPLVAVQAVSILFGKFQMRFRGNVGVQECRSLRVIKPSLPAYQTRAMKKQLYHSMSLFRCGKPAVLREFYRRLTGELIDVVPKVVPFPHCQVPPPSPPLSSLPSTPFSPLPTQLNPFPSPLPSLPDGNLNFHNRWPFSKWNYWSGFDWC